MDGFQPFDPDMVGGRKRRLKHVAPRTLDFMLNGMPVYIRRRPADDVAYATLCDFSKFTMTEPLEVVRKKFDNLDDMRAYNPETDPVILEKLTEYNKATVKDLM